MTAVSRKRFLLKRPKGDGSNSKQHQSGSNPTGYSVGWLNMQFVQHAFYRHVEPAVELIEVGKPLGNGCVSAEGFRVYKHVQQKKEWDGKKTSYYKTPFGKESTPQWEQ